VQHVAHTVSQFYDALQSNEQQHVSDNQ
ncbi:hypothetical protein, partial [Staphylococcus aureus]